MTGSIGVLCADDNTDVGAALQRKIGRTDGFRWLGQVESADGLLELLPLDAPVLLIMDLDMPGRDPLTSAAEIAGVRPAAKVVVFSGHVAPALIDRALDAGVWGYVSKNDGEDELLCALREVMGGRVALSPEVRAVYDRA